MESIFTFVSLLFVAVGMALSTKFKKKAKSAAEAFEEGKTGSNDGFIQVEDGKYIVRYYGMVGDVNDDGVMWIRIKTVVVQAEDDDDCGLAADLFVKIKERSGVTKEGKKWKITEAEQWARIADALSAFGADVEGIDADDLADQLEAIDQTLTDEQPACRINIKSNKNGFQNINWGKPVDDENLPAIDEFISDDDDPIDDDDEPEVDDDDTSDDSDDDDDDDSFDPPSKGDTVEAKPKGSNKWMEYEVVSVNKSKETCNLKREKDDKVFKMVPWGNIRILEDDE